MSKLDREMFGRSLGNPPDAVPVKRGPGRPRKNYPLVADVPSGPVADVPFTAGALPHPDKVMEALPGLMALLLAGRFADFGSSMRALFEFLIDVSPSELSFQPEARAAGDRLTAAFQASAAARNRVDVMTFAGARDCRLLGFEHGRFTLPAEILPGDWTLLCPWLDGLEAGAAGWKEHLDGLGVPTAGGLTVVASDFVFGDRGEALERLAAFKAAMRRQGQVVVAAMFGKFDREMAALVSDPLPPVPLATVPLDTLFDQLSTSLVNSLGRPGALEPLVKIEIEALLKKGA